MPHLATGGLTRGQGLAYLHKNELVINGGLTRRLDKMTSGRGTSGGASRHEHVIRLEGSVIANMTAKAKRELARMVADILAGDIGLDSRSVGANPSIMGESIHSFTAGLPA